MTQISKLSKEPDEYCRFWTINYMKFVKFQLGFQPSRQSHCLGEGSQSQ